MTPELHRPLVLDRLRQGGEARLVEATAAECAALAGRFGLPAIRSLSCRWWLTPAPGGAVEAEGELAARVVQTCVVTLEDFEAAVAERFRLRFVPAGTERDDPDPEAIEELPQQGGVIDLGEVTAEQLSLALDPYPRGPDAAAALEREVQEIGEATPDSPFAGLAGRMRGSA
jgi:hypothetical protein